MTCARNVIIPSPPHPTMFSVQRLPHRRSIKDVYMCKERYHPIPTPPQPTPLWSPANDNDLGHIHIYIHIYHIQLLVYDIYSIYIYIQLKKLETQEEKQNLKMMYSVLPTLEKKDSTNSTCVSTLQILPIRPLSFSLWACCRDRRPPWQWIDLNVQPQKCQSGKHVLEICV